MQVRALFSFVSPAGSASAGEILAVTPQQGADWIKAGIVEHVVLEPEVATQRAAPESAVTRKGRR